MKNAANNDELLIQYLLGELNEKEQEGIEQNYISDPQFYEQLLSVEDELIDAYVEGELSQPRLASFETHFLRSPGRQQRVGFAKAWMAYISRSSRDSTVVQRKALVPPPTPFSLLRFASWPIGLRMAAASLLVLAFAGLLAETLRLRSRLEQSELQRAAIEENQRILREQIETERGHSQELASQLKAERIAREQATGAVQSTPGIISLILWPGLVRGSGDAKRLLISADTQQVRLQARFVRGEYDSYAVIIKTVSGAEIWRRSGLKASTGTSGKVVIVQLPASAFRTEDYILSLSGLSGAASPELIQEYFFSVSRK